MKINFFKLSFCVISMSLVVNAFAVPNPASDSNNLGGWVLNDKFSDEFDGTQLDNKWFVQGTNDDYYLWKGRAPSQFAPHNVLLQNGRLKLRTQWEPNFNFADEEYNGAKYENITTAGIIHREKFLYGYMETKVKIPNTAMSGAFWATGYESELDIFEHVGDATLGNPNIEKTYQTSIHDWRTPRANNNRIWTNLAPLTFTTASDFHIYGVEWAKDSIKIYLDGQLIKTATQAEMGDAWLLNNPIELWFDCEVFSWYGIPTEQTLPADFDIEYVRVWQKPSTNLIDTAFFGFEGPIVLENPVKPARFDGYNKFWWIDANSLPYFAVTSYADNKFATGRKSLKFSHSALLTPNEVVAFAPQGSIDVAAGDYTLSLKIFIEANSTLQNLNVILESPWTIIEPIDLTNLERGKWLTINKSFTRTQASGTNDRIRVVVKKADVVAGSSTIYIDDIQFTVQDNTPVAVSGIALDVDNINLAIGQSQQIMESISPDNASNKNVLWQSENPTIATVNNAGLISAIAAGDTEILATTVDGNFAASVDVAVTDPQAATAINITPSSFSLMAGRTKQLAYTIIPTSAQNAAVTWHVLDSTIATVTNTGLVTALKAGTTQISLQAVGNSVTASSQITVTAPDITEPVPEPESSSSSGGSLSVLFMLFLTLIRAIKRY